MRRKALALPIALAALSGCGARDTDPGPGGVTVEQARQLDAAADKLERGQKDRQTAPGAPRPPRTEASAGT